MTIKLGRIPFSALLVLGTLAIAAPAFAQDETAAPPADAGAAAEPAIDPVTGLPVEAGAPAIDPVTGLPVEAGAPAIDPVTGLPVEPGPQIDPVTGLPIDGTAEAPIEETEEVTENPYGLTAMLKEGDWITRGVFAILVLMFSGTFFIFITKYLSQGKLLGQAKAANTRFWQASSLDEGASRLDRGSAFRALVEEAQAAAEHPPAQVGAADWIGGTINRFVENVNSQLQGGNAFLATVASTAPFVGLFGTVWGILHALLNIGLSGQPSIDKVAGPVGEALIMTAIGLGVAVPAVFCYNVVIRRNRQILDALRNFGSDVQSYLLGATPAASEGRRKR